MALQVTEVREHAMAHYESGWDVVVECYTDDDIREIIETGEMVAMRDFEAYMRPIIEHAQDIRATEF